MASLLENPSGSGRNLVIANIGNTQKTYTITMNAYM